MKEITIQIRAASDFRKREEVLADCAAQYDAAVTAYTADWDAIALAVNTTFDQHRGTTLNAKFLENAILTLLNVSSAPKSFTVISKRVQDFIKENKGEQGKSLLGVEMGPHGGYFRWSDKK